MLVDAEEKVSSHCVLPPPRRICNCCLFACLLATLRESFSTDLHEIGSEGSQRASEQRVKFWWRSGSQIRIQIRIMTLGRRALAEVCSASSDTLNDECQSVFLLKRL